MNIRSVQKDDRSEWLRLRQQLYDDCPLPQLETELDNFFAGRYGGPVFVLDRENRTLGGFIELSVRSWTEGAASTPVPYIESWYVDPDLRRSGWGTKLVQAAETWAKTSGYTEIASDCDLENETNRQAHLKMGYTETLRHIHFSKPLTSSFSPQTSLNYWNNI